MERKSQVQIPKDLLLALFQYHLAGNEEYLPEIEKALMEKLDSMVKRQLYTTFKTGTPIKVAPVKQIIPNNKIYTIIFFTDCLKSTILFSEYSRPNLLIYGCKR